MSSGFQFWASASATAAPRGINGGSPTRDVASRPPLFQKSPLLGGYPNRIGSVSLGSARVGLFQGCLKPLLLLLRFVPYNLSDPCHGGRWDLKPAPKCPFLHDSQRASLRRACAFASLLRFTMQHGKHFFHKPFLTILQISNILLTE